MRIQRVNGPGGRPSGLAWREDGPESGPVLVLLHGFPLDSRQWLPQLAGLAGGWRVLAPDLAGFGDSPLVGVPRERTLVAMASEVLAWLDQLQLDRVVLGGLSMGGYVAFALRRLCPERIRALVLADTRPGPDSVEVRARRHAQQDLVEAGGVDQLRPQLVAAMLGATTRSTRPELVASVLALTEQPAVGLVGALDAMANRADYRGDLAGIDVPTLVLVGNEDTLSPVAEVAEWQARIPGSELVVLPGAGHLSNLEAPEVFTVALSAFLADHS
ncbi:MAG: alpha/beta fold hydrolase [Acidimicrobiales bacterium]